MAKIKTNSLPIATRTRSKKNAASGDIKKMKFTNLSCSVILHRLTTEQILAAVLKNVKIDEPLIKNAPKYSLRSKLKQTPTSQDKTATKTISKAISRINSPVDMTVARLWIYLKKTILRCQLRTCAA